MAGLLIITHADLAGELLRATEMIIGPVRGARAVSVRREDSVEVVSSRIQEAYDAVAGEGGGVIIMTDMFGGTPTNLSLPLVERYDAEIIAGVNLPMVIKFFNSREHLDARGLARLLRDYTAEHVVVVRDMLSGAGRRGS